MWSLPNEIQDVLNEVCIKVCIYHCNVYISLVVNEK